MTKVIVIGASGNLGTRLVRQGLASGHEVSVFVRSRAKLEQRLGAETVASLRVFEGDASDRSALVRALEGQEALVNAAGHILDGAHFTAIIDAVLAAGLATLGTNRRMWFTGGAPALSTRDPHRKPGGLLSGLSPYGRHLLHLKILEASGANWSMACPGPMVVARDGRPRTDLVVSADILPFPVGHWARYAPPPLVTIYRLLRLPKLIVSYEDVAAIMMANLDPDSAFARARVGFGLPPGVWQWKPGWLPGLRGATA